VAKADQSHPAAPILSHTVAARLVHHVSTSKAIVTLPNKNHFPSTWHPGTDRLRSESLSVADTNPHTRSRTWPRSWLTWAPQFSSHGHPSMGWATKRGFARRFLYARPPCPHADHCWIYLCRLLCKGCWWRAPLGFV